MKNSNIILTVLIALILFSKLAVAQGAEVKILSVTNPQHSNAIQIGDVMNRTIVFEADAVYQLPKTALPMKGESRNGIELRDVVVQVAKQGDKNIYTVALSYQVFASAGKPVVMQLPAEHFALTGGEKNLSADLPVWKFWYSPLVAEGITNAKDNLQPQHKPALIDLNAHYAGLWFSLALLATGLLGLIYVNADSQWLPFMRGAFAQAHRSIKKLPAGQASDRHALMYMHQAFNKIYGANLFVHEIDRFLTDNPRFNKLEEEIRAFFQQSNASLFAVQPVYGAQQVNGLVVLSRRLRDCERGV